MTKYLLILAIAVPVFLFIYGKNDLRVPAFYVNTNTGSFETTIGYTYLNNHLFSGWQYDLYPNGDTAFAIPFYEGKEQGIAKEWYEDGRLKEVREYADGKKTGVQKGWWKNGRQRFIYHCSNDLFNGEVKEWYENGQLYRSFHYTDGHENGLQQIWRQDGKIFANYEARNGRNYGLTGTMHCQNTWKYGM